MNQAKNAAAAILLVIVLCTAGYAIINSQNVNPQDVTPKTSPETLGVCVHAPPNKTPN